MQWRPFGREAFDEARDRRRPVLLVLDSPERFEASAVARLLAERFVPVLSERGERPDVAARYKGPVGACVLSAEGEFVSAPERDDTERALEAALRAAADGYRPGAAAAESESGPFWTGAVGAAAQASLDPQAPRRALAEALAAPAGALPAVELLLHAAAEWGDGAARSAAAERLDAFLDGHWDDEKGKGGARNIAGDLSARAYLTRLLADGAAALGSARCARAAAGLAELVLAEHRDAATGGFALRKGGPVYADENARAAVALLRASPFGRTGELVAAAESALLYLERSLYDPMLGMVHRRTEDGAPLVYNLLGDNAETAFAFLEAYSRTARKPYRDFADALIKHLFQELWDRDSGGFLDRAASDADVAPMRRPLKPAGANAVAFEALWRLHQTKGNANYRRWLEWGLKALTPDARGMSACALAPAQDMLERGRMDLELVGRVGEPATDALLAELHRHYAPRRIVSFVDPDDQDYILAHKLARKGEPQLFPRVFGCVELRPVADAGAPEGVAAVIAAVRAAELSPVKKA